MLSMMPRLLRLGLTAFALGATGLAADVGPSLIASAEPGWPQFRGPRRDGVSPESGLLQAWPEGGPQERWAVRDIGRGFSAPVIAGGRILVTGDFADEVRVLAYDLEGKPLWQTPNGRAWTGEYPGARASAAVSDGAVYHENAHGRVVCLDAATGRERWAVDLLARYGGANITWGLSECVVVDERAVYATAGGSAAFLVALDKRTGTELWRSGPLPDPANDQAADRAGYASPILLRFAGRRLLVGCSLRHLYGVDADTGAFQWVTPRPTTYSVQAMMPVLVNDGVFVAAPYGRPGTFYRLVAPRTPHAPVGVEEVWSVKIDACQGGMVAAQGRLYGAHYTPRKGWAAIEATSGRILFETAEPVKGAALFADDRLYALSEDGWMRLLAAGETQFQVKGAFRLAEARARDAWAHPVVYDGRLYLRYHDTLRCYVVRR